MATLTAPAPPATTQEEQEEVAAVDAPMADAEAAAQQQEQQAPVVAVPSRLRRRRQRAPSDDDDNQDEEDAIGPSSSSDEEADTPTITPSASSLSLDHDDNDTDNRMATSPRHLRHRAADAAADAAAAAAAAANADNPHPPRPPSSSRSRRPLVNRVPTPQDLAELSYRIYKKSPRRLYAEADAQGLRVWRDERVDGDVRIVLAVPAWFPKPGNTSFDWSRVQGDRVSVVVVVRGTVADLVGNTRSNLQMLYSRLVDDGRLPDSAHAAASALQRWLLSLVEPHPELGGGGGGDGGGKDDGASAPASASASSRPRLSLDVTCTGHSLGAFIAEAATVENDPFAAQRGWSWRAVTFDGPGLPQPYADAALARRGGGAAAKAHWRASIRRYLAAPNPINMLYPQTSLGTVVHALVPFEQTWSHVARCVVADAARVLGWAVAATVGMDAFGRWRRRRRVAAAAAVADGGEQGAAAEAAEEEEEDDGRQQQNGGGGETNTTTTTNNTTNNNNALLQGAAAVAAAQLRRAGVGAAVPVLGPLAAWALGAAGLAAVPECLAAVLGVEVDELLTQHGLGSLRPCFDPDTGELREESARLMRSWPHLGSSGQVVLLSACKQVAAWTLPSPLCPGNVGVVHLSSRSRMVEARCRRLAGYVPLGAGEGFEVLDREDEEAEAAAREAVEDKQQEAARVLPMAALPSAAPAEQQKPQPQQPELQEDTGTGPLYSAAEAAAREEGTASWGAGGTILLSPPLLQELPAGPELDAAVATPLRTAVTVAAAEALRLRPQRDPAFQAPPIPPGLSSRARQAQLVAAQAAAAQQAAARRRQQQQQLQRQRQQQSSSAASGRAGGGGGGGGAQRQLPGPAFA
jgi:hypothetical protein